MVEAAVRVLRWMVRGGKQWARGEILLREMPCGSTQEGEEMTNRTLQNREAKRRQREREAELGKRALIITVPGGDMDELEYAADLQRGPREGFYLRALLIGAKFLANAGTPRGRKMKSAKKAIAKPCSKESAVADTSAFTEKGGAIAPAGSLLPPCPEGIHGQAEALP